MKLRTRLFLWVGVIFLIAFGLSLMFEVYTTDKNLSEAENQLRQEILDLNEKRRENMENFLHVSLSEDQAQIDSLLLRLSRDANFGASLFIDPKNVDLIAPAHSAYLYKSNKWLNFIQTTKDTKLTSLMVPLDFPMKTAHKIPIDETICWVLLDDDKEIRKPYIGVRLESNPKVKESLALSIDEMIAVDWGLTIFFDPVALGQWEKKPIVFTVEIQEVNLPQFLESVEQAATYVRGKSSEWIKADIQKRSGGTPFKGVPFDRGIRCLREEGEVLNNRIIELLQRGDQAVMLAALASLYPGQQFGDSPFAKQAPKGIARFPEEAKAGHLLFTRDAFFEKKMFDDRGYVGAHPSTKECDGIGSSMAVIAPSNLSRVFVGNTLSIEGKTGKGFLTLGMDADEMVQDLVLSINQDAFLVHQDKVVSAFDKEGNEILNAREKVPFKKEMLDKKSGIIKWRGENFYFLHMLPFPQLDLHFYILTPEKTAFALVNSIQEGSREVIDTVSRNMRIIAVLALVVVLFLLHRVARRITKPIVALANVTKDVASGRLEGIEIPKVKEGRHDEISSLCNSFEQMVSGLKEKEKVKGVLNKVVSPEIAEEITKGNIHLGGEEKKVTVFFADIRNFTHMSAAMPPQEVVEMLNTCMTKASHEIDEFGGVIDKYVGDEVMALFGAPLEKEDSALKAVQCGLKIIEMLQEWNRDREAKGLEPIHMGIGIHTGTVLVGNMGAENRLNYTVIGSNVNFAARLCSAAAPMEILISKETLDEKGVSENINVEERQPLELKGYDESFVVYIVKGGKDVRGN